MSRAASHTAVADPALDHQSPVPLYHQLAEALRYRIATGELAPGNLLPPLRAAAERWGVNLHTVRQAYGQLARDGVVVTSTPGGTRVLPRAGQAAPAAREQLAYAQAVARDAKLHHGLEVDELIALLRTAPAPAKRPTVAVVECSRTQSEDLAGQLENAWQLRALPCVLGEAEPPPGPIVATYFHYNDIRRAWPARLPEVSFVPIVPEAALAARLAAGARGRTVNVTLCERDEAMARNIAADLLRILPAPRFKTALRVVARPEDGLDENGKTQILFSPRMWGELGGKGRKDPRAHQVRYLFEPGALAALAAQKDWSPR